MKNMKKETKAKTKMSAADELLKKLGASFKTSPLEAHARGVGETVAKNEKAKTVVDVPMSAVRAEPNKDNGVRAVAPVAQPTKDAAVAMRKEKVAVVAAAVAVRKPLEKKVAEMIWANSKEMDQGEPESLEPEGASRGTNPQIGAWGSAAVRELTDAQMERQQTEMEAMKKMMAEIAAMKEKITQESMVRASVPTGVAPMPATGMSLGAQAWKSTPEGSQRLRTNGWRTSTVGLYPEDYDKAYEVMNYLRAQTGQAVNLSRVIKIALRMMEVGPKVLEANAQIRAKDGRLLSRRG